MDAPSSFTAKTLRLIDRCWATDFQSAGRGKHAPSTFQKGLTTCLQRLQSRTLLSTPQIQGLLKVNGVSCLIPKIYAFKPMSLLQDLPYQASDVLSSTYRAFLEQGQLQCPDPLFPQPPFLLISTSWILRKLPLNFSVFLTERSHVPKTDCFLDHSSVKKASCH